MPIEIINLLGQLPLVAVFIWYSERMNRQSQEFLREERAARQTQAEATNVELRSIVSSINEHDSSMDRKISIITDRVWKDNLGDNK